MLRRALSTGAVTLSLAFGAPLPAAEAEAPSLTLPIACTPGEDCWIVNYVDVDPGPGRQDFMCLDMSYDGHKGTDFGLANLNRIDDDVPVLAAAPGRVVGVRDEMEDVNFRDIGRDAIAGRECGNGVRINHGQGWATQYCHLKRDSVVVRAGQDVQAGQVLGAVGLSGLTEFPHLHMQLTKDQKPVDPFIGDVDLGETADQACGLGAEPLWDAETLARLPYRAPKLLDLGFAGLQVSSDQAESGDFSATQLSRRDPVLILWTRTAGVRPGDRINVRIQGPNGGTFFERDEEIENTKILYFSLGGRRTPEQGWPAGTYTADVSVARGETVIAERTVSVELLDD